MNKKTEDLIIKNTLVTLNKNFRPFEAKIYYGLLSKFTYEYRINNVYERKINMNVVEIKKLIQGSDKSKISFKQLIEKIKSMETWLKIQYDENLEVFESLAIITGIKIENDIATFILNNDICEMAKEQTKEFAIIRLMELSKLNSAFSLKAYELCCVYKNLQSGYYNMPREKMISYFNIPKSYSTSDIDKRVFNQIIKEINTKTRFELNISKVKEGKKITHYRFYIKENENNYLKNEVDEKFFKNEYDNKNNLDIKISGSNSKPDINRNNKVPATENIISDKEWFEKSLWNMLPSEMKKGKGYILNSKSKLKQLRKVGEENLNKCLKLYLQETKKLNRYFMNGSTWFNTRYEDYIEQVEKQKVIKKQVEYKTEDMIEKEFINLYMQKNREKCSDRLELNLKAQEEWIEIRINIIKNYKNETGNNISSEDLLNKLIKKVEKYKNE